MCRLTSNAVFSVALWMSGAFFASWALDRLPHSDAYRLNVDQSRYQLQSPSSTRSVQLQESHPLASGQRVGESLFRPIEVALRGSTVARLERTSSDLSASLSPAPAPSPPLQNVIHIPYEVENHLTKAGIPLSSVGIFVKELSGSEKVLLSVNSGQPMNPASTMKLVTTYAALEIMGGQHQWTTTIYRDGPVVDQVLQGNLIFKGTGDPKITAENFSVIVQKIQEAGIKHITGDVILDRSHFNVSEAERRSFDGASTKTYNVGADALMMGYKSIVINLNGDPISQTVDVKLLPHPKQVELVSNVIHDQHCGDWPKKVSSSITPKPEGGYRLVVNGRFSSECGEQSLRPIALANTDMLHFFGGVFENEWEALGGTFHGRIRDGILPANAIPVVSHQSEPLYEIVSTTNKISHNMFAKQLFYSIGAKRYGGASSVQRTSTAINEWLQAKGLVFPELVMENGSGLSRIERISPQSLGLLLEKAAYSPMSGIFMQSLPVVGEDGTMKRRLTNRPVRGRAFIKTGTLRDVKAIAGYVTSITKRNYIVVFIINHPKAGSASGVAAQDRLIEWVYFDGPGTQSHYPTI